MRSRPQAKNIHLLGGVYEKYTPLGWSKIIEFPKFVGIVGFRF